MDYPLHVSFYDFSRNKHKFVRPVGCDRESWNLFAVEEGCFRYGIGGMEGMAGAGDIVLCPPDCDLFREVVAPLAIHYLGFIPRSALRKQDLTLLEWVEATKSYKIAIKDTARLFSTLRFLKDSALRPEAGDVYEHTHYVNDLWMLLNREFLGETSGKAVVPDREMEAARRWLEEGALRRLRLSDLAVTLGMSRAGLTRNFRASFGCTPKAYLTMMKMEKAKYWLVHTNYTLDHIAALCGYESGYYFSRMFHKQVSVRPSAYRNRFR